jgi:hypothetical protein
MSNMVTCVSSWCGGLVNKESANAKGNTKYEARNPKQIQMTKMQKLISLCCLSLNEDFEHLIFEFRNCLEFVILRLGFSLMSMRLQRELI